MRRITFPAVTLPAGIKEAFISIETGTFSGTAGTNDYVDITNVKLEQSSNSTPYVHPSMADSLTAAQWTYRKSFAYATAPAQNAGAGTSGEFIFSAGKAGAATEIATMQLGTQMRAAPTMTLFNPVAANAQCRDETAGADMSASAATNITEKSFEITSTGNAATAVGNAIGCGWVADARL